LTLGREAVRLCGMADTPGAERVGEPFSRRVKRVVVNLVILAAVLLVLKFAFQVVWFSPVLIAALAGAVVLPLAFPARLEEIASAAAWLGLAAVAYFYFGSEMLAAIAGVIGVVSLMAGVAELKRAGPAAR
jgi:xanthine/uracil permease